MAGRGPRTFDPVLVGNRETDAWAAYYRHEWPRYELVTTDLRLDPARAAWLEVEWWRLHRLRQHDPSVDSEDLVVALVALYSYVYAAEPAGVRPAAAYRVEAMDLSDAWVAAGCAREDPLLVSERRALVASYTALRRAVGPSS